MCLILSGYNLLTIKMLHPYRESLFLFSVFNPRETPLSCRGKRSERKKKKKKKKGKRKKEKEQYNKVILVIKEQ